MADPRQPDSSDDESDDSDYVDSGGSRAGDGSESSDAGDFSKIEGDEEDKENRERRLHQEYASMKEARDNLYVPPIGARRDSVWESFNRRQGAYEQRKDKSLRGLMGMLSKVCYAASKKESPEEIDIARYKEEARAAGHASEHAPRVVPVGAVLDEVRKADKVEIDSHMKYAGRTVNVTRVVSKSSAEGAKQLRKVERERKAALGGSLGSLDAYLRGLKAGQVTSVEKSSAEWSRFKASKELDGVFEKDRRDGYLHKRAFLDAADERGHEAKREAEKRARKAPPNG